MKSNEIRINIYQMYMKNKCRFGFFITRDSWSNGKYAKVARIEDVEEGKKIAGKGPYFQRKYPKGHPKEGKHVGPRIVYLEAPWFNGGKFATDCGGNYSWTRVYPNEAK